MAIYNMNIRSQYLQGNEQVLVIMPDKPRAEEPAAFYGSGTKYKVLWLLHGGYGDATDWVRKSRIELYACENDLVVVMPSAMNSQYASWPNYATGYDMYSFLIDELMPMIHGWFPVSGRRADNFIAGLSMGGGGAMKYALTNPDRFAGAAVLSWAPEDYKEDGAAKLAGNRLTSNLVQAHGGLAGYLASADNLWDRFGEAVGKKEAPLFYFAIGEDDFFFDSFQRFRKYAEALGADAVFCTTPGYGHEWRFWDLEIQRALVHFGFTARDKGNAF